MNKLRALIKILITVCFGAGYHGGVKPPKYGKKNLETTRIMQSDHERTEFLSILCKVVYT